MNPRPMPAKHPAVDPPANAAVSRKRRPQERLLRRMPHRVPCRVRLVQPDTGESRTVMGETVNLSPTGVAIQLGLDVPVGTLVETLVPHAHGDPMLLRGTVVHSRRTMHANYEIGVATREDGPASLP